ncbi:hypothetical protein WICMUC_004449, partial [Wickerhamomyces mucosus]
GCLISLYNSGKIAWPPNGDMKIPNDKNRCKLSIGHRAVWAGCNKDPGPLKDNPVISIILTINDVEIIPNKLRCDSMSNRIKLDMKNAIEMMIFNNDLSIPNAALKLSENMMIIEIPALSKSMLNVNTTNA